MSNDDGIATTSTSPRSSKRLTRKRSLQTSPTKEEDKSTTQIKYNNIEEIIAHYTNLSEFCIGGKIELQEKASKFFYKTSDSATQCIDFLKYSEQEIETLINTCSVSPFGKGKKTVINPNVRQAKELKQQDFAFQFNPQMQGGISLQIKKFLGDRDFAIEPYKINIYLEGGHFKRHKDTVKNDKMIASLVICLPISFEGGILTVENEKEMSASFDWGKEISHATTPSNVIQWACFFCSCDHFISEVTKGKRITILYDIFTEDSGIKKASVQEMHRTLFAKDLQNYIKNFDQKKIYGYYPNHVYKFSDTDEQGNELRNKLQGNDLLLFDAFVECGWNVTLQVYYHSLKLYGPRVSFRIYEAVVSDSEDSVDMKDVISPKDKKKLKRIDAVALLNRHYEKSQAKIHDYCIVYGFLGNEAGYKDKYYYASTVMILNHQASSKRTKK